MRKKYLFSLQKWLTFFSYLHGLQFAPLPLPGPVVLYLDQMACVLERYLGLSSLWGWTKSLIRSCPGCVEAGEAWGVHNFISGTVLLLFCLQFFNSPQRIELICKKDDPGPILPLWIFRKNIIYIMNLCWIKLFLSWMKPFPLYKSLEKWQGSQSGLKQLCHTLLLNPNSKYPGIMH